MQPSDLEMTRTIDALVNTGELATWVHDVPYYLPSGQHFTYTEANTGEAFAGKMLEYRSDSTQSMRFEKHTKHGKFIVVKDGASIGIFNLEENLNAAIESARRINAKRTA